MKEERSLLLANQIFYSILGTNETLDLFFYHGGNMGSNLFKSGILLLFLLLAGRVYSQSAPILLLRQDLSQIGKKELAEKFFVLRERGMDTVSKVDKFPLPPDILRTGKDGKKYIAIQPDHKQALSIYSKVPVPALLYQRFLMNVRVRGEGCITFGVVAWPLKPTFKPPSPMSLAAALKPQWRLVAYNFALVPPLIPSSMKEVLLYFHVKAMPGSRVEIQSLELWIVGP